MKVAINACSYRSVSIQNTTLKEDDRTVELVWATSTPALRSLPTGERYYEILSFEEGAIDMERFERGKVNLIDHHNFNQPGVRGIFGVMDKGWIDYGSKEARGIVRFSKRPDVEPIFQDVKDGIITGVSAGYRILGTNNITKPGDKIPTILVTRWQPFEISLLATPEDVNSGARSLATGESIEVEFTTEEPQIKENLNMPEPTHQPQTAIDPNEFILKERTRSLEISKAVKAAKLDDSFATKLIGDGIAIDQARAMIIDEFAKAAPPMISQPYIRTGELDETQTMRRGMESVILHRFDTEKYPLDDAGRDYVGLSLVELGRRCLERSGIRTIGMYPDDIATRALTTTDFPAVLENVVNKTLRREYEAAPQTFWQIVREVSANDFKPMSRSQLGDAPNLEKVGENGEVKSGKLEDAKETYAVDSFGKIIPITRKTLVNDDLSAFTRIPAMFGRAYADLESDIVWGLILNNDKMGDGIPLFHTAHKNLATKGAAIDIGSISDARAAMRLQRGVKEGRLLNIAPKYLFVPTALETRAQQFCSQNMLANNNQQINPFASLLVPICEPRLDLVSPTAWHLFADPSQIDVIEVAYLNGTKGVKIESERGFEIEGLKIKATCDFGAKAIDWRGMYKNPGN